MTEDSVEELSRDIFRLELKAAEKMETLAQEYEIEEINAAMKEVIESVLENIESDEREGKVYLLTHQIGQALNSEEMAREGYERYQAWSED